MLLHQDSFSRINGSKLLDVVGIVPRRESHGEWQLSVGSFDILLRLNVAFSRSCCLHPAHSTVWHQPRPWTKTGNLAALPFAGLGQLSQARPEKPHARRSGSSLLPLDRGRLPSSVSSRNRCPAGGPGPLWRDPHRALLLARGAPDGVAERLVWG